ncbi:MAG TPA: CBS domain-containing protein [Stellaceae bacterium]|nr:CBS domain-containing protein [Stellaceae bacterium]
MKIKEIMTPDVEVAAPDDTVRTAAQLMADTGAGVLPVCDGERLVGMITDRDIAVRAVAEGKSPDQCQVRDVMTEEVQYALEDDDVAAVAHAMSEWQVRRLPILNARKELVGIVSIGDLALEGGDRDLAAEAVEGVVEPSGEHRQ